MNETDMGIITFLAKCATIILKLKHGVAWISATLLRVAQGCMRNVADAKF